MITQKDIHLKKQTTQKKISIKNPLITFHFDKRVFTLNFLIYYFDSPYRSFLFPLGKEKTAIKTPTIRLLTHPKDEKPEKTKDETIKPRAMSTLTNRKERMTSENEIIEIATRRGPAI